MTTNSWDISEHDFPRNGSLADKIEFFLNYAILAHSTYNNQPWYFVIEDDAVLLYADRRHALPVLDPDDRQLIISCGAALFNLRTAIRYFGYEEETAILPDPENEDLMARVRVRDAGVGIGVQDKTLFRAITKRHMNRGAYKKTELPREVLESLKEAARAEGAWLYVCKGEEHDVMAHFIAEGDRLQMSSKAFRRELAAWTTERRFVSGDGYPEAARPLSEMMQSRTRAQRRFESETGEVVRGMDIAAGCPVLAILGSEKGGALHRIYAGQAFMRVLLQAEALGVSVSTLNQPCEVPELRLRIHDEISDNHFRAQCILRLGYAVNPAAGQRPRRPLATFIETPEERMRRSLRASNDDRKPAKGGIFQRFRHFFLAK